MSTFSLLSQARPTISNARMVKAKRKPTKAKAPASLAALRRRIDALDDRMQDLLMRRAAIVGQVMRSKRRGKVAAFRPGREAQILRRLAARHRGRFPLPNMLQMWRELLSGSVGMQADLTVAAVESCRGLARDHFGCEAKLIGCLSAGEATRAVGAGRAMLAVLPLSDETETAPWWRELAEAEASQPRIVARLPFIGARNAHSADALVLGTMLPEASGDDATVLVVEGTNLASLMTALHAAKFSALPIASDGAAHLVEIDALVAQGEPRLERALEKLGRRVRLAVLGAYARPIAVEKRA